MECTTCVRRYWPLPSWAQYVQTLCQSIDWARPLTFVVGGDRDPCAGGSWSQLSIALLNRGVKARTPAFLSVVGMAVTGDKDMVAVGQILGSGAAGLCSASSCSYAVHNSPVHKSKSGGDNASGAVNDFHVASNWSRVGMGRGQGNLVRAV